MTKVGFVGLGRMGQSMALNMARKGFELAVFDINDAAMKPFIEFNKCRQAKSARDACADAEISITVLPGPAEIESVVLAQDGLLTAMPEGAIMMDLSTVLPETTDRLAAAAKARGCHFVDAPIGRLAHHADIGESLFMVGAEDDAFVAVKPALKAMGTTILHCGGPGSGTRTKLINNFLAIASCQMNAECMALTQHFNLDLQTTLDVIHGTSATNGQLKLNLATKVFKGDIEPGFAIDLAHKDLTLIIESANKGEIPMPMAATARESLSLARANGWGKKDFSGLADFWCEISKVPKARL
jgi:4-hydroxybutyrate dehydrogenase/sulfolactaldehyde 3-reductase